jgi:hypothetical protein
MTRNTILNPRTAAGFAIDTVGARNDCQGVILKTTPQPYRELQEKFPPNQVVPYRLPVASRIKVEYGVAPSLFEKLCRMVILPCLSNLNTVPYPSAPPNDVVP